MQYHFVCIFSFEVVRLYVIKNEFKYHKNNVNFEEKRQRFYHIVFCDTDFSNLLYIFAFFFKLIKGDKIAKVLLNISENVPR